MRTLTETGVQSGGRSWEALPHSGTDTDHRCKGAYSKFSQQSLAPSRDWSLQLQYWNSTYNPEEHKQSSLTNALLKKREKIHIKIPSHSTRKPSHSYSPLCLQKSFKSGGKSVLVVTLPASLGKGWERKEKLNSKELFPAAKKLNRYQSRNIK